MRALFALLVLSVASCATPGISAFKAEVPSTLEGQRKGMIGRWHGEFPLKEGGVRRQLMDRRADGTYTIKFQVRSKKEKLDQVEAGLWGIAGGVYFTLTREILQGDRFVPVDTTQRYFYDAYQVLSLDGKRFRYRSLEEPSEEYEVRAVAESFKLPEDGS